MQQLYCIIFLHVQINITVQKYNIFNNASTSLMLFFALVTTTETICILYVRNRM